MPKKILVVDDEPNVAHLIQLRLKANGFDVVTASDGADGLRIAKECRPDLILLDVQMPEMDGFKVLSELRKDPQTAPIPVVMLTAKGESANIMKAQEMRATDYIVKPFEGDELVRWVKKYT